MMTTDTKRMRSTHAASLRCTARLVGPAMPGSDVAMFVKQTPEQFGDRTPITGPPRGTTG